MYAKENSIYHKSITVDGVAVFYREAGDPNLPTILLLHGFPSSSHMFRNLIPRLQDKFHLIAPDMPGFGFTEVTANTNYTYSFDNIANTMQKFIDAVGINQYTMFVFDYGAPVGLRIALQHSARLTGFISQNGNAYEEGLGDAWDPIRAYWHDPSLENRNNIAMNLLQLEGTRWQYTVGVANTELIAPESYYLDTFLFERAENKAIQLDLLKDYINNIQLYPEFQKFFRDVRIPFLIIWGKNDPFFIPAGAEAFKRDVPSAIIELLDTGHFALETHATYIAQRIVDVMG